MTVRFLADENLRGRLVAALKRRVEGIDIVRVQDVGLRTHDDSQILAWAASVGRALLTHDTSTVPDFAYQRVSTGLAMPGVFVVADTLPIAIAIEEIVTIYGASDADEWANRVVYLPLR